MSPAPSHRPLRGIPTSRAYWELKAEQMMNRILDPDETIDLPVEEEAPGGERALPPVRKQRSRPALPGSPLRTTASKPAPARRQQEQPVVLLAVLAGVCMVSAASSVLYLSHWNQEQQNLRQERNLLLVERLRNLGPANPPPAAPAAPVLMDPAAVPLQPPSGLAASPAGDELPPPPTEAWIEELSSLPAPDRSAPPILRVPVSPRLAAAAPAAAPARPAAPAAPQAAPLPVLVGVVAAAGRPSSAIFQVGSSSTSVGVGEAIGTSGWKLRSAAGDTAEIEQGGVVRRVSISIGF
ncbi:MAG: hypothetical protein ACKO6F_06850 [Cyanobium sp.]